MLVMYAPEQEERARYSRAVLFQLQIQEVCMHVDTRLGIQIRNMKMVFNFYCTWRWVMFEKLMMKIYDFFLFG